MIVKNDIFNRFFHKITVCIGNLCIKRITYRKRKPLNRDGPFLSQCISTPNSHVRVCVHVGIHKINEFFFKRSPV